jgi:hypothetical protein
MTFLIVVATFIGFSCLVMPLVLLAIFAFVGRDPEARDVRPSAAAGEHAESPDELA